MLEKVDWLVATAWKEVKRSSNFGELKEGPRTLRNISLPLPAKREPLKICSIRFADTSFQMSYSVSPLWRSPGHDLRDQARQLKFELGIYQMVDSTSEVTRNWNSDQTR